jgi:hypothetical protein
VIELISVLEIWVTTLGKDAVARTQIRNDWLMFIPRLFSDITIESEVGDKSRQGNVN